MSSKAERIKLFKVLNDILWNEEGFNPQECWTHFLMFFAFRLLEPHTESLEIPVEAQYSTLINALEQPNLNELFTVAVSKMRSNPKTRIFFQSSKINENSSLKRILEKINSLDEKLFEKNDILGELYQIVNSANNNDKNKGQYFTDRKICRLVFHFCFTYKPEIYREDGSLCSFMDPFCGTGGFGIEFIRGMKKKDQNIDWTKANIYCFDRNAITIPTTLLNLLIVSGQSFNGPTIRTMNSFRDNISLGHDAIFPDLKIDFGFTNPPWGGDTEKESGFIYKDRDDFQVNEDIQSIGIVENDKVSAAVQLTMTLLADGGIQAIVLPQGFFSGRDKIVLRRLLAEEYCIRAVITIDKKAFIGTNVESGILIFQKGIGPTEKVEFYNVDYEILSTASLEELREKKYSLNYKRYIKTEEIEKDGYELVRFGDIATANTGKNKTPDDKKGTLYPYYGTSSITGYTDHFLIDGDYILIARNGSIGNIFLISGKSYPSDHMFIVKTNKKCMLNYLYYYLFQHKEDLRFLANTTTIPGITKTDLLDIKISLPSLEAQEKAVRDIERWTNLVRIEKETLSVLETAIQADINFLSRESDKIQLKELLIRKSGPKHAAGEGLDEGLYPLISSSKTKKRYLNVCDYEEFHLIVGKGGIANIHLLDNFNISNDMLIFQSNEYVILDYVYYYLLSNMELIEQHFEGTTIKHIRNDDFLSIEIRLLDLEKQEKMNVFFSEVQQKKKMIKEYQNKMNEMLNEYFN
jgi:restriction endonuclease S subunit